jgi:hypothetical protein
MWLLIYSSFLFWKGNFPIVELQMRHTVEREGVMTRSQTQVARGDERRVVQYHQYYQYEWLIIAVIWRKKKNNKILKSQTKRIKSCMTFSLSFSLFHDWVTDWWIICIFCFNFCMFGMSVCLSACLSSSNEIHLFFLAFVQSSFRFLFSDDISYISYMYNIRIVYFVRVQGQMEALRLVGISHAAACYKVRTYVRWREDYNGTVFKG